MIEGYRLHFISQLVEVFKLHFQIWLVEGYRLLWYIMMTDLAGSYRWHLVILVKWSRIASRSRPSTLLDLLICLPICMPVTRCVQRRYCLIQTPPTAVYRCLWCTTTCTALCCPSLVAMGYGANVSWRRGSTVTCSREPSTRSCSCVLR